MQGLDPPDTVASETDAYFEAQDSFSIWVEECCERDANAWTLATKLFGSWKVWAEKAGVRYGNVTEFGETMERAASSGNARRLAAATKACGLRPRCPRTGRTTGDEGRGFPGLFHSSAGVKCRQM
jgi:phage/plasmid-associated DNA primase